MPRLLLLVLFFVTDDEPVVFPAADLAEPEPLVALVDRPSPAVFLEPAPLPPDFVPADADLEPALPLLFEEAPDPDFVPADLELVVLRVPEAEVPAFDDDDLEEPLFDVPPVVDLVELDLLLEPADLLVPAEPDLELPDFAPDLVPLDRDAVEPAAVDRVEPDLPAADDLLDDLVDEPVPFPPTDFATADAVPRAAPAAAPSAALCRTSPTTFLALSYMVSRVPFPFPRVEVLFFAPVDPLVRVLLFVPLVGIARLLLCF